MRAFGEIALQIYSSSRLVNVNEVKNPQQDDYYKEMQKPMINWHKSYAIWLSHEARPAWHPHPAFKWINQGASTKYLGFLRRL